MPGTNECRPCTLNLVALQRPKLLVTSPVVVTTLLCFRRFDVCVDVGQTCLGCKLDWRGNFLGGLIAGCGICSRRLFDSWHAVRWFLSVNFLLGPFYRITPYRCTLTLCFGNWVGYYFWLSLKHVWTTSNLKKIFTLFKVKRFLSDIAFWSFE